MFFPLTTSLDIIITALAVIGFVGVRDAPAAHRDGDRRRPASCSSAGVYVTRGSLPGHRAAVEPTPPAVRLLHPLPADGRRGYELVSWGVNGLASSRSPATTCRVAERVRERISVVGVSILLVFGWMYEVLPFDGQGRSNTEGEAAACTPGDRSARDPTSGRAVADGWTRYNWHGLRGPPVVSRLPRSGDHDGRSRRANAAAAERSGRTTAPTASTARRCR